MNVFGYPCKTLGCGTWLKVGDFGEDSPRVVHVPINVGHDPVQLTCPDCLKTHDYFFSEKEIQRVTTA